VEAGLTPTEKEILKLVAVGETDVAIGRELSLTAQMVTAAIRKIFRKIDAPDRFQAVLWAGKNF
jgi:LuxR family transcriptional regulator of csgAB operon